MHTRFWNNTDSPWKGCDKNTQKYKNNNKENAKKKLSETKAVRHAVNKQ